MRKLDKIINNQIVQMINAKYGIGLEAAYLVYKIYGDSKEAHRLAEFLKNKQDAGIDICADFSDLVEKYHLSDL